MPIHLFWYKTELAGFLCLCRMSRLAPNISGVPRALTVHFTVVWLDRPWRTRRFQDKRSWRRDCPQLLFCPQGATGLELVIFSVLYMWTGSNTTWISNYTCKTFSKGFEMQNQAIRWNELINKYQYLELFVKHKQSRALLKLGSNYSVCYSNKWGIYCIYSTKIRNKSILG